MTVCGYTSRNIPDAKIYEDMLEKRMVAKKTGDVATANALKLVANTTYGAMLNKYNDLFDPLMGRSVCITGQLFLLELANHLQADCKTLEVVQLNTDGIMVSFDDSEYDKVLEITAEWQQRTGFELEEDRIKAIFQKDVNGYIEIPYEGDLKIKGGYLVRGISKAGAFNVNNNMTIVATAIVEYFMKGTPVEETINNCDDIFEFQIIAKAGAKYKEAYHLVDGEKVPVQKVNRIYATNDERYGKIYKVKAENDMTAKIESLPEHCIIDNDNQLTIDKVDRTFYIDLAKKRINDYMGIKPEKKGRKKNMATKKETTSKEVETPTVTELNIYQKLLLVRDEFAREEVKKSGKNIQLSSFFYELKDIVPVARPIFTKYRLLPLTSVANGNAVMTVVDVDSPENKLYFELTVQTYDGNKAVTPPQAYGAVVTYYRRYLYMVALDIVEADYLENNLTPPSEDTPETNVTPMPTAKKPEQPSSNLTDGDSNASELQIQAMKNCLKKLLEIDPSKKDWGTELAIETKGFTVITRAKCEAIVKEIQAMIDGKGDN